MRDVYDDMMLDGVQPTRDVFHSLIVGTMKGARLQDGFYFKDQMKVMGLLPDVCLHFFLLCYNPGDLTYVYPYVYSYPQTYMHVYMLACMYICLLD